MAREDYEIVIGLEVHCELSTKTKIFCSCPTEFGGEPNTHCCPICMAMPGTLPVLNEKVVEYAVKAGLATNCSIEKNSKKLLGFGALILCIVAFIAILNTTGDDYILKNEYNMGGIMNPFRLAIVGEGKGPHMFDITEAIGKEETITRFKTGTGDSLTKI